MVKIEFFPLDFDSIVRDNQSYVRIFGKTKDGKRICIYDKFDQYLWAIPKDKSLAKEYQKKINQIKLPDLKRITYVKKTELHNKKFLGKDVTAVKVFLNHPGDMKEITSEIKNFKEDFGRKEVDVPIFKKYLIENKIRPLCLCAVEGKEIESNEKCEIILKGKVSQVNSDIIKPKILAFDIECYNGEGSHAFEDKNPVIMISFYGSEGFKKMITWKKFDTNQDIEFVENEAALIIRFKDIINEFKPDYLLGYYSDGFDFPYLRARADKNKIKLNIGLDGKSVRFNKSGTKSAKIKGFCHIDVLRIIKDIMSGDVASGALQLESFSLNEVAKFLLNEEKIDVDIGSLGKCWDENKGLEKYCLYNLKDSKLCYDIFMKVIENIHEIVKVVGQPIQDVSRMSYGTMVEWYIMKNIEKFNEIIPNKPGFNKISARKEETYQGAFVFQPNPGLYGELVVLDFRSLYPSIISAHNICVSTITDSKEDSNETPDIDGERYYFTYKFEGFLPLIVRSLVERRIRIKEMIKKRSSHVLNARSYALKILANAFYGYFGFFGARWYNIKCARSITAFARKYLSDLIKKCQEQGFKVIYGDTDGVFLSLQDKKKEEVLELVSEFNKGLPSLMELEYEKKYNAGIFVMKKGDIEKGAKKKYALIEPNGKIKIRGFETIRRDWSYLAREIQKKVLEIILKEKNKSKALEYVKNMIDNVKNKRLSINKMIIRTQLKKNISEYHSIGPHVAVARRMKHKGISVGPGSVISYVVCEGKGLIRDRAKPLDEAEEYDASYYINNQIIPAIEKIFDVIGYSKEDLVQKGQQKKLGEF